MGVAVSSASSCFPNGYFPLTAGISVLCIDFIFLLMISIRIRHERKIGFKLDRASEGVRRCRRQHL